MPSVQADLTVVSSFHVHIMAHAALKVLLSCKALLLYSAWANTSLRLSECECSVARLEEDKRSPETLLRPASWLMALQPLMTTSLLLFISKVFLSHLRQHTPCIQPKAPSIL